MYIFLVRVIRGNNLGKSLGTCFFIKLDQKIYCITCVHCILTEEGRSLVGNNKEEILKALKDANLYVLDSEYSLDPQSPIRLKIYLKGDPDDLKEVILKIAEVYYGFYPTHSYLLSSYAILMSPNKDEQAVYGSTIPLSG